MITYQDIFEQKIKFKIINNYVDEIYQFQENETEGEFINQHGQVIAQLVKATPDSDWFSVAGIFMGQIIVNAVQYRNLSSENDLPLHFETE